MAEVRVKEKQEKYNIDEIAVKKNNKSEQKKIEKKDKKVKKNTKKKEEKKSLWVNFRIFCHGVKSEFKKVHWPSKKEMVCYSIASIFFIVFCSLFFYLINVIFALIQTLFH